jgi:hypothetical protein
MGMTIKWYLLQTSKGESSKQTDTAFLYQHQHLITCILPLLPHCMVRSISYIPSTLKGWELPNVMSTKSKGSGNHRVSAQGMWILPWGSWSPTHRMFTTPTLAMVLDTVTNRIDPYMERNIAPSWQPLLPLDIKFTTQWLNLYLFVYVINTTSQIPHHRSTQLHITWNKTSL